MLIQEPVHAAIWHCLNHYAYGDATFLAERLFSEIRSDDSLHLLATCYYRSRKFGQAYDVLQTNGSRGPQNKFLLAKCCIELSKLAEAEAILGDPDTAKSGFGDGACFALQLLAGIYVATERGSKAAEAERQVLEQNPFLWKSFESLCSKGEFRNPSKVFNADRITNLSHCLGANPILMYANGLVDPHHVVKGPQQHLGSSSTSTPIVPSQLQQGNGCGGCTSQPPPQPSANFVVVTPVDFESSVEGAAAAASGESLISMSLWSECSQISGVGALNLTNADHDRPTPAADVPTAGGVSPPSSYMATPSPQNQRPGGAAMPPPLPRATRVKRMGPFSELMLRKEPSMVTPIAKKLVWNSNGGSHNVSFGHLPQGPVRWDAMTDQLVSPSVLRLAEGCPLSVLSPCKPNSSTPTPSENLSNSALMNTTNSEQKALKRSLTESNHLKSNIFGPSGNSQNITPQQSNSGVPPSTHNNMQNVRRSSRLFVSTQQSAKGCKENTKAPPPSSASAKTRKSKSRFSSKSSQAELVEKNERNKQEEEKDLDLNSKISSAPCITVSDADGAAAASAGGLGNPSLDVALSQKVLCDQAVVIQKASINGLMALLRQLGGAYAELSRFNSRNAIQMLEEVPTHQKNSGWVLGLVAKAHFELGEYKEAKKYFKEMMDRDPHRLELTEYFSTALWHLQDEVELSWLAQELVAIDRLSPQAWCAAGNCFSHQKEHENAIKFFKRAVQVDPKFSYAYTLLGHEYVMIEELEKALSCFRSAVRVDPRHYNAWYGIGLTYYKQERYALAEIYYKKALGINPQNPVLMCHVAVVQHALQKSDRALETLNSAIAMAPRNPLCKFERASILFATERYQEALQELNELKQLVPKESPVFFLIGKVHNKLGNTHLALMHFSWAMDLDPKGANSQIKDALDPALNRTNHDEAVTLETTRTDASDDAEGVEDIADVSGETDQQGDVTEVRPRDGAASVGSPGSTPPNCPGPSREPTAVPMEHSSSPGQSPAGGNDDSL